MEPSDRLEPDHIEAMTKNVRAAGTAGRGGGSDGVVKLRFRQLDVGRCAT